MSSTAEEIIDAVAADGPIEVPEGLLESEEFGYGREDGDADED